MATAYIGLGANLGDRLATLRGAVSRLHELGSVEALSSVYETDPVGFADQPAFLNAVARLRTELAPRDLFSRLRGIERAFGRVRSFRNAPRTLDLDLLLVDDLIVDEPDLTVPHPRLHERAFVLVPLAELAPELEHPRFRQSIAALRDGLGTAAGVRVVSAQLGR